eukprot:m.42309 g.42309  ORF g.42309 m.42309 type:complete len:354 (+) comp10672_c0_seq2:124-1185(+)
MAPRPLRSEPVRGQGEDGLLVSEPLVDSAPPPPATLKRTDPSRTARVMSPVPTLRREISTAATARHWSTIAKEAVQDLELFDKTYWMIMIPFWILSLTVATILFRLLVWGGLLPQDTHAFAVIQNALPEVIFAVALALPPMLLQVYNNSDMFRKYYNLELMDAMNCSITWLAKQQNGSKLLRFRNIAEFTLDDIVNNNKLVIRSTLNAAEETTKEDPILYGLSLSEADYKSLLMPLQKAITGFLSSKFAEGVLLEAAGNSNVQSFNLVLAITCEKGPLVPQTKIRVIAAEESLLEAMYQGKVPTPTFQRKSHSPRWDTLHVMANYYGKYKNDYRKLRKVLFSLEVSVVTPLHV